MLQSILVCPNESLHAELDAALLGVGDVEIVRVFTVYPTADELMRAIRVRKPHFLFLAIEDFPKAEALAAQIDNLVPGLPIVALDSRFEPDAMPKLMHLGIREYLTTPITPARLIEVIDSIKLLSKKHPPKASLIADLYTFFPAKPGVGCSTIATGAACALADDLGTPTLLMDCDLAAGGIKFLLKLGKSASIVDAVGHAGNLDEDLWSQMIGRWDKLDVLHAGDLYPVPVVELPSLHSVLSLARSQYRVICADLASSLDPFTVDLMRESRKIFVVTTAEVVSLHFAAVRIKCLNDLGVGDRISVLLNRKSDRAGDLEAAEVARSIGQPVAFTFANDFIDVEKAILEGGPISHDSELGEAIMELARTLMPHLEKRDLPKPRKFLEFFHVGRTPETEVDGHP